ncbi:unnamed protein product, partial [Ranitomeya imitator]
MVGIPMPAGLNKSMSLAIQIGRRLRERKSVYHLVVLPEIKPEPMQCDRTMTRVERQEHRRLNGLCFYCGDSTHAISDCPKRTKRFARSAAIGTVQSKFLLSVTLICSLSSYSVMAFVDSGAALNLMDLDYAKRCGLLEPLQCPIPLRGIDATPLAKNKPQYWTQLTMCMAPAHQEVIRFLVLHNLHDVVVLGLPWLQAHNPVLDWNSMLVSSWGCQGVHGDVPFLSISSSTPSEVPEFLSDYRDVFDEPKSDALPPHRDCDCAINLIPGSKFPKGRLFNLSVPEHTAMRNYVKESLEKGHIRPSSSPLGAGFFFVAKKDGSLRPCIDYRLLNKITVKFQYPLPLLSDLFARIKGASWFTKMDLRGAYNLVRIRQGDEWKTAFNMPEGHFEYLVMSFGLANAPSVFQSFMHDIFREYLDKFLIVYLDDILIFSDDWESHVKQVEVDASEIGAGAVLSQRGQVESSDCPGVDTVVDRLQQIWTQVVDNLTLSQEKAQLIANRRRRVGPRLRIGDLVWLSSRHIPMKVSSPKFKPRFIGKPYIPPQIQEMETTLELNSGIEFEPTCRVSGYPKPTAQEVLLFKEDGTMFQLAPVVMSGTSAGSVYELPLVDVSGAVASEFPSSGFCADRKAIFPILGLFRQVESSDCPSVDTVVDRLQQIWTHVVDNLTLSQEKAQRFANRRRCVGPRLRVGDLVWLSSRYIPMKVSSPKFKPRFIGPYRISEVLNPVSFRLTLPASFSIHNVFHRSLLRRYVAPVVPSVDPPAPVLVEGELEYIVEKILDSRISRRKLQYLVKWKGYGQEDNSWVFASDVHAADLVRAFHLAHPGRPGGSGEGSVTPPQWGGTVVNSVVKLPPVVMSGTSAASVYELPLVDAVSTKEIDQQTVAQFSVGRTVPRFSGWWIYSVTTAAGTDDQHVHIYVKTPAYFVFPVEGRAKYCSAQALGLSDLSRHLSIAVLYSALNRADKVHLRRSRSMKTRRGRHRKKMRGPGPDHDAHRIGPPLVAPYPKYGPMLNKSGPNYLHIHVNTDSYGGDGPIVTTTVLYKPSKKSTGWSSLSVPVTYKIVKLENLEPKTEYKVCVQLGRKGDGGVGHPGPEIVFTTEAFGLPPPKVITLTPSSQTSLNLTWLANEEYSEEEHVYEAECCSTNALERAIYKTTPGNGTGCIIDNLKPKTLYQCK